MYKRQKYTWCITESPNSPWSSLHEDRGFKLTDSTTSVFAGLSPIQVSNHHSQEPDKIPALPVFFKFLEVILILFLNDTLKFFRFFDFFSAY